MNIIRLKEIREDRDLKQVDIAKYFKIIISGYYDWGDTIWLHNILFAWRRVFSWFLPDIVLKCFWGELYGLFV